MNVKSSFLNGVLEEEVYVEKPSRYIKFGKERKVLKLKALYGLKQANMEHSILTPKGINSYNVLMSMH